MEAVIPQTIAPVDITVCDHPPPLTDFDGAAYMGTWYEQTHVKYEFF
jgi:lipocalin